MNKIYVLIFLLFTIFFISCDEEKEMYMCEYCLSTDSCVKNRCVANERICVNEKVCSSGEICENNICYDKSKLCGEELCRSIESCIDDECINLDNSCGSTKCTNSEICVDNICKKLLNFSTFNLYDLENKDAHHNLAKFIWKENINLMVSQEIQVEDKEKLKEELKKYGVDVNIKFSSYGGRGNDYLAIISRFPLNEVKTILSGSYEDPISENYYDFNYIRPVLEIKLSPFGKDLVVYNLHLKAQYPFVCDDCVYKRRAQAYALENYIKNNLSPEIDDIIIAGDMNTVVDDDFKEKSTLDMLSLKSDNPQIEENDFTPINYTYKRDEETHTRYSSILDHIILSPSLLKRYKKDSIDIVTPSGIPSDHKAVILTIE